MGEEANHKIDYKDILILLGLWYFIFLANILLRQFAFAHSPFLTDLFQHLFLVAGRFLYATLFIFYLVYFYAITYCELGFKFFPLKPKLKAAVFTLLPLATGAILLINIPLSFNALSPDFQPLYRLESPEIFINSLFPLTLLFFSNIIVAGSEQLILNTLLFSCLKSRISVFLATAVSSLIYALLVPSREVTAILLRFMVGIISIYLYRKAKASIITPTLFQSGFYSLYIVYIYGWTII
ncbi:MAG: type II CAAX prenyl endopeptidase Rce1 family protein [Halanaerobiales bacterium]